MTADQPMFTQVPSASETAGQEETMSFVTAYRTIKPCVAAVIQTFYPAGRPDFPTILGTGFLASRLGLLCTCRHVADAVRSLPRPAGFRGEPASALFFTDFALEGQRGVGILERPNSTNR